MYYKPLFAINILVWHKPFAKTDPSTLTMMLELPSTNCFKHNGCEFYFCFVLLHHYKL